MATIFTLAVWAIVIALWIGLVLWVFGNPNKHSW